MCAPGLEHGGPLLGDAKQACACEGAKGRCGNYSPALRFGQNVSAARAHPPEGGESRCVGECLKQRVPRRMRTDGDHGRSIAQTIVVLILLIELVYLFKGKGF